MHKARWFVLLVVFVGLGCRDDLAEQRGAQGAPEGAQASASAGAAGSEKATGGAEQGGGQDAPAGPMVRDEAYQLQATGPGPYRAGELANFAITLLPQGEWHVNQDYPMTVTVEGPTELEFAKLELEQGDAAEFGDERARFDVPFTAKVAGSHRVSAHVSFAVCTPETCIQDDKTLALNLPVE